MQVLAGPGGPVQWGKPLRHFAPDKNERCLEIPLALLAVYRSPLILDGGCALNMKDAHDFLPSKIVHVNISGETAYQHPRRQYVSGDLRALPFGDKSFPAVTCLSTLEHIGCDNRHYKGDLETDPASRWQAVEELRRVASDVVVFSMPYGLSEMHPSGRWHPFGMEDLSRMLTLLQPATTTVAYYLREPSGWRTAGPIIGQQRAWRDQKMVTGLAVVMARVGP